MAQLRARRRQQSGIGRRHSKFLRWDDLKGPPEYIRVVRIVRDFVERGDAVLALIGRRGSGKTQVASVAVWQTIEGGKSATIVTALALLGDLKRRYVEAGDSEGDWRREWTGPHLLAIDEVAEIVAGDHSRAMFTALLDARYCECRPTLLLGNVTAGQLVGCIGSSIASRCSEGGGLVLCDGWGSFRTADFHLTQDNLAGSGDAQNSGSGRELQQGAQVGQAAKTRYVPDTSPATDKSGQEGR